MEAFGHRGEGGSGPCWAQRPIPGSIQLLTSGSSS